MEEIRPVTLADLEEAVRIIGMAYPGNELLTEANRQLYTARVKDTIENDTHASFHGCYRGEKLVGTMKWFDFSMNVHGTKMLTGGIGSVAVDLLYKKEKIAKQMLHSFLYSYRERGISLVSLYPFRVDFYKQMGFGIGSKINQYKIKPSSLPYRNKGEIAYLGIADKEDVLACYNRVVRKTHGMISRNETQVRQFLEQPQRIVVGSRDREGGLGGYLAFRFERAHPENRGYNNIAVDEFIYETREAFAQLLSFLHSQADQVQRILLSTQDEHFQHLLSDPGNGSNRMLPSIYHESNASGVGLMYRIIDVPLFIHQLSRNRFGTQSCLVRFTLRDTFVPENDGSWLIQFEEGLPQVVDGGQADAEVTMDISDFSSLAMGVVSFEKLYLYGLAELDDESKLPLVQHLFAGLSKPTCMTAF